MEATWDNINYFITLAIAKIHKNLPDIPLDVVRLEKAKDGSEKCYVYFHDIKLKNIDLLKRFSDSHVFRVVFTSEILTDQTTPIDLVANIPHATPLADKLMLRIAYIIKGGWEKNILRCFRQVVSDPKQLTWVNAKKWYDGLQ